MIRRISNIFLLLAKIQKSYQKKNMTCQYDGLRSKVHKHISVMVNV